MDEQLSFQPCEITAFDAESQRFRLVFKNGQQRDLKRIFICFDSEDPRIYSQRVSFTFSKLKLKTNLINQLSEAHQRRLHADSLIRFIFYIENMPITSSLLPSSPQLDRIKSLSRNDKWDSVDSSTLLLEVQQKYAQTLNQITFTSFMEEGDLDMLPHHLQVRF